MSSPRCQEVREIGEGRVKPPHPYIFMFLMCVDVAQIGKMFLRRRLDVFAPSKTKLKGRGEVMFVEVVGRVSGVAGGREKGWSNPFYEMSGC